MMERIPPTKEVSLSAYEGRVSIWKSIVLGVLTAGCAFVSGYLTNLVLFGPTTLVSVIIPLSIVFMFFLVFLLLSSMFIGRYIILIPIDVIATIAIILPFWKNISFEVAIGVLVMVLIFITSAILGRREMDSAMNIRFFAIAKTILSKIVLGVAIFISVLFFVVFSGSPLDRDNVFLSEKVFTKTTEAVSKSLGAITGGFDFSSSLNDIVAKSVSTALEQSGVPKTQIPQAVVSDLTAKYFAEYKAKLEGMIGTTIDPNEKLSISVYGGLLKKFNTLDSNIKKIVLGVMAFVMLLTLLAIAPIIRIVAALLAFLVYELLMITGFGAVVYENRSKEVIIVP